MTEETLPDGWERSETNSGIPYYINHNDGSTHWEHPYLSFLLSEGFEDANQFKYATYRVAMKLRELQKMTNLNLVNLHALETAFRELGLGREQTNEVLQIIEVEAVLSKIFRLTNKDSFSGYNKSLLPKWAIDRVTKKQREKSDSYEPEKYAEVTLSWILKCYDSGRTGVIKVRSLKVCLVTLCHATIQEKYAYLYDLMSNERNQLAFSSLKILIQDLLELPHNIEESVFSLDTASDTAKSCWNYTRKEILGFVTRDEFGSWLKREPVSLVWLPTLFRLATSETVKHEAKCSECKAFPIVGIRYRCLKCTNMDLCQVCFWKQINTVKNHKITHPTREYCLASTTGDDVRDFAKQMKNKVTRKYRRKPPKKNYLDYPMTSIEAEENEAVGVPTLFNNVHTRINGLAERLRMIEEGEITEDPVAAIEGTDYPQEPQPRVHEVEHARERTEEFTRAEIEARNEAEEIKEAMESEIEALKGKNQELAVEVEQLTQQLYQKPKEIRVPFTVPAPPPKLLPQALPAVQMDKKSQAVNTLPLHEMTSSSETYTPREWATSFLGEQQELDSIVSDLLTAFSFHTNDVLATDLGHELFIAATVIGNTLSGLVEEVASTQDL